MGYRQRKNLDLLAKTFLTNIIFPKTLFKSIIKESVDKVKNLIRIMNQI